jgi:hypothetical protein
MCSLTPSVLDIPYILQAAAFTQYDNVKNFLLIIASKTEAIQI